MIESLVVLLLLQTQVILAQVGEADCLAGHDYVELRAYLNCLQMTFLPDNNNLINSIQ
jgi:hypothetical protein